MFLKCIVLCWTGMSTLCIWASRVAGTGTPNDAITTGAWCLRVPISACCVCSSPFWRAPLSSCCSSASWSRPVRCYHFRVSLPKMTNHHSHYQHVLKNHVKRVNHQSAVHSVHRESPQSGAHRAVWSEFLSTISAGLSASASLVSLAWMISSYQKALRDSRDDKLPMTYKAVVVQILWHLFTIGARALAFALFASVFQLYFGIFIVAHWCIMTFWIIQGETDFCMSKWEEIIYNMMVGIVYVFCWFSVREGRTRCRMLIYSLTVFAENVALTTVWYLYRGPRTSDFYAVIMVCVVASSYALGTFFMFVYYCLLHPDGPVSGWGYIVEKEVPVESLASPATSLPPDLVSSPPRTLLRTKGSERDHGLGVDGDVFQVRPPRGAQAPVSHLTPRTEGPVIRIDLPRKQYPAWDAHYIDRRLRKTILVLEKAAPVTPRIQYRCLGTPKEVMEYETTVWCAEGAVTQLITTWMSCLKWDGRRTTLAEQSLSFGSYLISLYAVIQ